MRHGIGYVWTRGRDHGLVAGISGDQGVVLRVALIPVLVCAVDCRRDVGVDRASPNSARQLVRGNSPGIACIVFWWGIVGRFEYLDFLGGFFLTQVLVGLMMSTGTSYFIGETLFLWETEG